MTFDLRLVGGSIQLRSDGDLDRISGQEKLTQDAIKIVVTPTGTHRAHPWYGSTLDVRVTGSVLTDELLENEVKSTVALAIQNLQSLQQQQERAGQFLAPEEAIAAITKIELVRDTVDPRQLIVIITIRTRSGKLIQEQIGVSR